MGFRFKKVIKIAPGVKLNISKSGVSTSLGGRGATLNLGRNGARGTLGIPGTGLSYSKQLTSKSNSRNRQQSTNRVPESLPVPSDIQLDSENKVVFVDANGHAFPTPINNKLKKEHAEAVHQFLEERANELNSTTNQIEKIHSYFVVPDYFYSVPPVENFPYTAPDFNQILEQVKSKAGGFSFFQQGQIKQEADVLYQNLFREYHQNKTEWTSLQQQKVKVVRDLIQLKNQASTGDIPSMERFLQEILLNINAPIHFSGSFEVEAAEGIWLDIDLPEIEEIPDEYATILKSGALSLKKKSQKKIKEDYAQLVSGIALILSSYVFELLPTVENIVISGYTQRINRSNGLLKDDYIYSIIVNKDVFRSLNLQHVNPLETFSHFQPVVSLTNSLEWKEISPYYRS